MRLAALQALLYQALRKAAAGGRDYRAAGILAANTLKEQYPEERYVINRAYKAALAEMAISGDTA